MVVKKRYISGMAPYSVIYSVGSNPNFRPDIPLFVPPQWAALVRQCWDHDPAVRPAFAEILQRLNDMHDDLGFDESFIEHQTSVARVCWIAITIYQ